MRNLGVEHALLANTHVTLFDIYPSSLVVFNACAQPTIIRVGSAAGDVDDDGMDDATPDRLSDVTLDYRDGDSTTCGSEPDSSSDSESSGWL
jgi:hypothetical protein